MWSLLSNRWRARKWVPLSLFFDLVHRRPGRVEWPKIGLVVPRSAKLSIGIVTRPTVRACSLCNSASAPRSNSCLISAMREFACISVLSQGRWSRCSFLCSHLGRTVLTPVSSIPLARRDCKPANHVQRNPRDEPLCVSGNSNSRSSARLLPNDHVRK